MYFVSAQGVDERAINNGHCYCWNCSDMSTVVILHCCTIGMLGEFQELCAPSPVKRTKTAATDLKRPPQNKVNPLPVFYVVFLIIFVSFFYLYCVFLGFFFFTPCQFYVCWQHTMYQTPDMAEVRCTHTPILFFSNPGKSETPRLTC